MSTPSRAVRGRRRALRVRAHHAVAVVAGAGAAGAQDLSVAPERAASATAGQARQNSVFHTGFSKFTSSSSCTPNRGLWGRLELLRSATLHVRSPCPRAHVLPKRDAARRDGHSPEWSMGGAPASHVTPPVADNGLGRAEPSLLRSWRSAQGGVGRMPTRTPTLHKHSQQNLK